MGTSSFSVIRTFAMGLAVAATIAFSQGLAKADEVTIVGSSTGIVTGVAPLTFVGNSFDATTALGVGALSGVNRLGTFTLAMASTQNLSGSFQLNITFTLPTGINGGQNASYTATINGTVSPVQDQGGVNITFAVPAQVFTFNTGSATGSFTLTMANLFVQTGRSADLTAGITGSQQSTAVPEPASMLLLGSGLVGAAGVARRRFGRRS